MSRHIKSHPQGRMPRELMRRIKKHIAGNAKRGFPLTARELAEHLQRIIKDARITVENIQNLESRMGGLPRRGGSRHKGKWVPVAGGPKTYDDIDDFIAKSTSLPDRELMRLCNLGISALRQRKYRLRAAGKLKNTEHDKKMAAQALDNCILEFVEGGILMQGGMDALHQKICAEFPHHAPKRQKFGQLVRHAIWESSRGALMDKALQGFVRVNTNPRDAFAPLYPYIPASLIDERAAWHRGVSHTKENADRALPGIGRMRIPKDVGDLTKFKMPQTSFEKPFRWNFEGDNGDLSIMFLNGANIGTRHGRDIVGNIARRTLSDGEFRGENAIILTNLISLDLKKAGGPQKVNRAHVGGDNINPLNFGDLEYRAEVESIIKENPIDKVVYQTAEELFDNVLSGWTKICVKPDKELEFPGTIFVVLGANEEDLINTITYWEINYQTKRKQIEIDSKLKAAKKALAAAEEAHDQERIARLSGQLNTLQERRNRTTVTDTSNQEYQRFYNYARALVVRKIEKAIPNSKVIGQGTTQIQTGSLDSGKFEVNIPSNTDVTDAILARFTGSYGPKNLREQLAPTTVICAPWALNFRMTIREADYDGKRGSAQVFVAPIAVDDAFLRQALRDVVRKVHPLAKAVFHEQFKSGVLRLRRVNGIVSADILSIDSLESFKTYPEPEQKKKVHGHLSRPYERGPKYIWVHTATDQHWGGRAKEFVTDKRTGRRLGMAEAVFEMMRREGLTKDNAMPVHLFASNDDGVQGQNFPARTQPHPHERPFNDIENKYLEALRITDPALRAQELAKVAGMALHQIEKRGSDFPHEQMFQMINRHVSANADIFSAILRRAQKASLVLKGVGAFGNSEYDGFDTRNVGVINFGSGNHLEHTIDGEIIEGPFYALHLRTLLSGTPEWKGKDELLKKLVVSPLYSGKAMAWGTMKVPGGYEYGLDLRASPARMAGWADPLLGAVKNDPMRGNYSRIFNGRMTLKTYGDKHFFASVATPYAFYHMCASGTHTDCYGDERGFPPNNTGVSFVGLPADGPEKGPILLRILTHDVIKDFVEDNPRPFNWNNFLPNPA